MNERDAYAALERLVAWHDRKPPQGPDPTIEEVERWWSESAIEERRAFDDARAALDSRSGVGSGPRPPEATR